MATRRLLVFLSGALAIGIGAAWMASDFRPVSPGEQTCQVDVPYAALVQDDQATFDLPFEPGASYRVIVASIAPEAVQTTVTLSAEPVPAVERFPLIPVPELQSAMPQKLRSGKGEAPRPTGWAWADAKSTPFVPQGVPPADSSLHPSKRTFYLHVTDGPLDDARQYAKVVSHRVAEGRFVRVFLDSQMQSGQLARGLAAEIVRLFDEEIVPGSRKVLGQFRDVDGDGKFAIVISPWLGKLQGGQTALGGFVRGSDFLTSVQSPFGNRADVLYLNSNLQPGPHLKTLLAHEYAHAICFSERLPTASHPEGLPTEDDWLNEAIAHLAENVHGTGWTNLDYRISRFLDATDRSPLVVRNYYANGLWRDPGCRGATYLFLRHIVDQFGEEVLSRLIRNSEPGVKNLETATGVPFPDLFRGWTIALAQADREFSGDRNRPIGPYRSLYLTDRLGRWSLQGPRPTDWDLNQECQTFSLMGTTAKMIDIRATAAGVYRLRVRTSGKPHLQVTVIRQNRESAPANVAADWQFPVSLPAANSPSLHVRLPAGRKIIRVSLECLQGGQSQSSCWEGNRLRDLEVPSEGDGNMREYVLHPPERMFPSEDHSPVRWQLKILSEDECGRRSAQWRDLATPQSAPPDKHQPVASGPADPVL